MLTYFNDANIFQKYFYVNFGNFISLSKAYQSLDSLPGYAGKKSIVIDAASDPWNPEEVKKFVKDCNFSKAISAVLVNEKSFAEQNQDLNFRFFPVWAYRYAWRSRQHSVDNVFSNKRKYKVSCLNRIPKLHRLYTYYCLNQFEWCDEVYLSFHGTVFEDSVSKTELSQEKIKQELGSTVAEFFSAQADRFPVKSQQDYDWGNCHEFNTPAYTDCYSNLCTESSVNYYCPTEKTFKCIVAGNLIFPVSCGNFVKELLDLGLDINYQGLNLDNSDTTVNWKGRITAVLHQLNQAYDNLEDIWIQNKESLINNQEILINGQLENHLLKNIQDHYAS